MSLTLFQKNILHSLKDGRMHPKEIFSQNTIYSLVQKNLILIIDHPNYAHGAVQLTR